jgi:hypothetical protein
MASYSPGRTNSTTDMAVRPPANNENYNRSRVKPTVPGGQPPPGQPSLSAADFRRMFGLPETTAYAMPDLVQSAQGPNAEGLPSAAAAGQYGQSSQMEPDPVPVPDLGEPGPINQEQPLQQHVGENYSAADLLSLVRPPQTPNSPTAIQHSTSTNVQLPLTQDTEAYRLAAMLARKYGTADGMGGTPSQAGSGGIPIGYG